MSVLSDVQSKIAGVQAVMAARPQTAVGGMLLDGMTAQIAALLLVTSFRVALEAAVTASYSHGGVDAVVVSLIAAEASIAATANTLIAAVQAQSASL